LKKILIIEDDEQQIEFLKMRLDGHPYEVITAKDGDEGLTMATDESPNLVILDLMMPTINGLTICRVVKENEEYKNMPVIVITARITDMDTMFDGKIKPDAYLTKPLDAEVLIKTIEKLL